MNKHTIWNKKKSSGTFRRRVKASRRVLLEQLSQQTSPQRSDQIATPSVFETDEDSVSDILLPNCPSMSTSPSPDNVLSSKDSESDHDEYYVDEHYFSPSEEDLVDDFAATDDIGDNILIKE